MQESTFSQKIMDILRAIPRGRVCTYGAVAACAGNHRAARQVVRVLHASSRKENLPWHRVVNKQGKISLKSLQGFEEQRELLMAEGVDVSKDGRIDLGRYFWDLGRKRS